MKSEFTIGRTSAADVVLPTTSQSDTVSGVHIRVAPSTKPGLYVVEDLHSTNGFFVLRDGTWIRASRALVSATTRLKLGLYETSLKEACSARPYRNEKGEIVG